MMEQATVTRRQRFELLRMELEQERSTFIPQWRDLNDFILPFRARFNTTDTNRGDRRNLKIIDPTATLALRTAQSGMMAGATSPARPWFRITTADKDLSEIYNVKEWTHLVAQRIAAMFLKSNLYNVLPILYGDLLVFATAAMFVEKDVDDVLRFTSIPIGEYCIAKDRRGKINTFQRSFRMTVDQVVGQFVARDPETNEITNWDNVSKFVKELYMTGNLQQWIDVCHIIMPNPQFNPRKLESRFKKYLSVYYELGSGSSSKSNYMTMEDEIYLSEKGFDYFPVLCPRWAVTGNDVYGTSCPGMIAIGDIKQLQAGEKSGMRAIEKMINPAMVGPPELEHASKNLLPGGVTYLSEQADRKFRPAHEVNLRVDHLENKQDQVRNRIKEAFYENLFLRISNDSRSGVTAREIEEIHQEKFLAVGPVLEQLNEDVLDDLINIAFDAMVEMGELPEPPEELQGKDLKIEYISPMAQAQKSLAIEGIERLASFAGNLAAAQPSVLDKLDLDQFIDEYSDSVGTSPKLVRSDDATAQIRQQRADLERQQIQQQAVAQGAVTAKNLSQTNLDQDSALKRLLEQANAGAVNP